MTGWHRPYLLSAVLTLIIASTSFVAYRNHDFTERELNRAREAAIAIADGRAPLPQVIASALITAPKRSKKYPFLSRRVVVGGRALGGPEAPRTDKLLYDASARAEKDGAYHRFLPDGSGWVVAAVPTPKGIAVAITEPPSGPQSFPWLVIFGLLSIGALVAAAGALVGGPARSIGLVLGASGLAVPTYMWSGGFAAAIVLLVAIGVAAASVYGLIDRVHRELVSARVAYTFLAPAGLAMFALVATPFVIGIALGFYDHHHGEWTFVGIDNFVQILSGDGRALSDPLNFWFTLGVTALWTGANVVLHVSIGVAMAMLLRQKWLTGKGIYRMLLILPWAIPNYITALIWRGMFQGEYGAINSILDSLGLDKVSWFSSWVTAFTANVTTNTWLGFPFMMVVALGALESIPRDMYEAAEVDGASGWQRFVHITLPHLRPALGPAVVLGAIWTFNMFNVIYLVSGGQPGGSTDILVTEAYRWAFERGERYGLASAYATIIFLILLLWTVFGTKVTKKEAP